tara:strand:- start:152 stop:256 length:105 start_codon:yes stop_codon:yes gene_type:complete
MKFRRPELGLDLILLAMGIEKEFDPIEHRAVSDD